MEHITNVSDHSASVVLTIFCTLSAYLPVSQPVSPSVCCLPVCLPVCLLPASLSLAVCLSVYLAGYLTYLSLCLTINQCSGSVRFCLFGMDPDPRISTSD
jgi:hypothetical protein